MGASSESPLLHRESGLRADVRSVCLGPLTLLLPDLCRIVVPVELTQLGAVVASPSALTERGRHLREGWKHVPLDGLSRSSATC